MISLKTQVIIILCRRVELMGAKLIITKKLEIEFLLKDTAVYTCSFDNVR